MASSCAPVSVEKVSFAAGRMTLLVTLAPDCRFTTPEMVDRLLAAYPDLPHHACVNDAGPTFAAVMNCTSVAHLLEHLVISEQLRLLEPVPEPAAQPSPAANASRAPQYAMPPDATAKSSRAAGLDPALEPVMPPSPLAPAQPLFGATSWVDQKQGRARIQVSFVDDIVALKALDRALKAIASSRVPNVS